MEIRSFDEFWPMYIRAHSRGATRVLHAIGSVLAVVMLGVAFALSLWFLIAVPLVGYAFAWYAHFFVEHNRPATFGHPFWSWRADQKMRSPPLRGASPDARSGGRANFQS